MRCGACEEQREGLQRGFLSKAEMVHKHRERMVIQSIVARRLLHVMKLMDENEVVSARRNVWQRQLLISSERTGPRGSDHVKRCIFWSLYEYYPV